MVTQVTKVYNAAGGAGVDFTTREQVVDYVNGLDLLALDQNVAIEINGFMEFPSYASFGPLTCNDTHRVTYRPASGQNVNVLATSTLDYGTSGAEVRFIHGRVQLIKPGQIFENLRVLCFHVDPGFAFATSDTNASLTAWDVIFRYCRFKDTGTVAGQNMGQVGAGAGRVLIHDCLAIVEGAQNIAFAQQSVYCKMERVTMVARGAALGSVTASNVENSNTLIAIGFGNNAFGGVAVTNCFANTTQTNTTGTTVVTAAGGLVVNETNDFRPATSGALIRAGLSSAAGTKDILGTLRGINNDAGPYQRTVEAAAPTATVTNTTVSGSTVTITGTTTNTPTSATASLTPTNAPYNESAAAQNNVTVSLGAGTFTVTFSNVMVGQYLPTLTFTNSGGPASATGVTTVTIAGATGTLGSQTLDGQTLTITGTTTGNPTSGTLTIAADNPANGATAQGPVTVTLGAGTFSVSLAVPPGNYDVPVVRFATAYGTGVPVGGTTKFAIIGISGNPVDTPDPNAPTVSSVTVSPSTSTGSATFSATVSGTNSPSQAVTWSATAGTITSGGVFTAPAATSSTQTITITATSVLDPTKSGTATVTIAAAPVTTVTSVTVSPATATGSTTFSATVNGTNSPSQSVTWTATGGSITSGGVFTAPAATSSDQNIVVKATSVADPTKYGVANVTIAALPNVVPPSFSGLRKGRGRRKGRR